MTPESSIAFHLNIYDFMTPTEKRICCAFGWYYKLTKIGDHETSYPPQRKISKLARCSIWEVSRFVKNYRFLFTDVKQQKRTTANGHNLYQPNIYKYLEPFFDTICFLKEKGWVGNWKKMRVFIITKMSENEELTKEILGYNAWVMNNKNASGLRLKTQTKDLRDSSNPCRYVPTKVVVPQTPKIEKKSQEKWKLPGLSDAGVTFANRFCSNFVAREIMNDFEWYTKKGNIVRNPDNWMLNRLIAHKEYELSMMKRMNR